MNIRSPLKSHAQSPVLMQPRKCPLHNPAILPQTAPMLGVSTGQRRLDSTNAQLFSMRLRIIRPIPLNLVRSSARPSPLASQRRDTVYKRDQLGYVMRVGARQDWFQGNSPSLGGQVMLAAGTPSICGIRPGFFPPLPQHAPKRNPQSRASSRSDPPGAAVPEERDKSSPRHPPAAIRAGGSSTSCRNRNPSRGEAFPRGFRFSGRRECPSGRDDHRAVSGPDGHKDAVWAEATGAG